MVCACVSWADVNGELVHVFAKGEKNHCSSIYNVSGMFLEAEQTKTTKNIKCIDLFLSIADRLHPPSASFVPVWALNMLLTSASG